jgi:hypothetical protein
VQKARRRRRVPPFGEWNYNYYNGESSTPAPAAAEWYAPAAQDMEACSDMWFKYSPPPRKPPNRKARRPPPETRDKSYSSGGKRREQAATPARASDAGAPRAPAKKAPTATGRVVRSVDADLYQDLEPDEPRRMVNARVHPELKHPYASSFSVTPHIVTCLGY